MDTTVITIDDKRLPKTGAMSDADLVREICALAAGIDLASARMLVLIGELDARSGWAWPGVMSCAHWVSWKLHLNMHSAREYVRVARAVRELPLMKTAFLDGRLSYSKVRALQTIEASRAETARRTTDAEIAAAIPAPPAATSPSTSEALTRPSAATSETSPRGRLDPPPFEDLQMLDHRPQAAADALVSLARAHLNGDQDTERDPDTELIVTVDAAVLTDHAGKAAYRVGGTLSAREARRIACDTRVVVVVLAENSGVLDVSAASRTIPAPLKRALIVRDRGCCTMPGCDETRATRLQAHHVWHCADGGPTVLDNLVLLCRSHHRAIHHDHYTVRAEHGIFIFADPDGRVIPAVSSDQTPPTAIPDVDPATVPTWDGTPLDLDYVISVLLHRRQWRRNQQLQLQQSRDLSNAA